MTQAEMVLDYLQEHEAGLTTWEAIQFFHITRLAARINDLEKQGYHFKRERIEKVVNDKILSYTRYTLITEEESEETRMNKAFDAALDKTQAE